MSYGALGGIGTGLLAVGQQMMQNQAQADRDEAQSIRESNLAKLRGQLQEESDMRKAEREEEREGKKLNADFKVDGRYGTNEDVRKAMEHNASREGLLSQAQESVKKRQAERSAEEEELMLLAGEATDMDAVEKARAEGKAADDKTIKDVGYKKITSTKEESNEAANALRAAKLEADKEKAIAQIQVAQAKLESTATTAQARLDLMKEIAAQNARLRELQIMTRGGSGGSSSEKWDKSNPSADRLMTAANQLYALAEKTTDDTRREQYIAQADSYMRQARKEEAPKQQPSIYGGGVFAPQQSQQSQDGPRVGKKAAAGGYTYVPGKGLQANK